MTSIARCCRIYDRFVYGVARGGYVGAAYCTSVFWGAEWMVDVLESMRRCGAGRLRWFRESFWKGREWGGGVAEFRPWCMPPLLASGAPTRWWFLSGDMYIETEGGYFVPILHKLAVSEGFEVVSAEEYNYDELISLRRCREGLKHVLQRRGSALLGQELPVVRRRSGYLRIGKWLAWHRVLGVLDYGAEGTPRRWVVVGDDGLYTAEFVPTVDNPLAEFGEVGYVRVVEPFQGDVDEVASPCGAPRLVACSEEGVRVAEALLGYVAGLAERLGLVVEVRGWGCSRPSVIPQLVEVDVPNSVVLDWPLSDACPHVLRAADGEPLGLFTPGLADFYSLFVDVG